MTFWEFADKHPVLIFFLAVILLFIVNEIASIFRKCDEDPNLRDDE